MTVDRRPPLPARVRAATTAVLAPLAVGLAVLLAGDTLPTPPLGSGRIVAWASGTDPVLAALAVARLVALAVVALQVVAVALGFLAHAGRDLRIGAPARALAARLALPPLRRLLETAFGISLGLMAGTGPALAAEAPPATTPVVTMHLLDAPPPGAAAPEAPVVTMRALPATPPATVAQPVTAAPQAPPPPTTASPAPPAPPATASGTADSPEVVPATWTIAPGDHLWRVAVHTLAAAGRPTDDATVSVYLARLIEHNRGVLVVPDEPDLVFAGQVFVLPPL